MKPQLNKNLTSCAVIFILHILLRYISYLHYSRRKWNISAKLALHSTSKWHTSTLQNCLVPTAVSGNSKTPTIQRQSSLWNAGVFESPVSPRGLYIIVSPRKPQNLNMSVILQNLLQNNCASIITLFLSQSTETNMCWNM